jgi:hypothetical protein
MATYYQPVRCRVCNGVGKLPINPWQRRACSACHGNGWVYAMVMDR